MEFAKNAFNISQKVLAYTGKKAVKGAAFAANTAWEHREEIAGGLFGAAKEFVGVGKDVYGSTVVKKDIEKSIIRLNEQSREYSDLCKKKSKLFSRKELLIDSLGVGCAFIGEYLIVKDVPYDVQMAYEMAYPIKAQVLNFDEAVSKMNEEQLEGFISGIKGKLFEIRYTEYLNDGHLPEGFSAVMSESATNPGWDIAILDSTGLVADQLQLKATESVEYVQTALSRYPDIPVVTTDEVYGEIAMRGFADNVINSNISEEELTAVVEEAIDASFLELDFGLPVIPLLLIGYSVYKKENLSSFAKGTEFGERYIKSYLAYIAGGTAAVVTSVWWIGLIVSIGTSQFLGKGRLNYGKLAALKDSIRNNDKILNDLRAKVNSI